jgi:hypothetical protein
MLYNQAPVRYCGEATHNVIARHNVPKQSKALFSGLLPALQSQFLAMTANAAACAIFKVFTPPH